MVNQRDLLLRGYSPFVLTRASKNKQIKKKKKARTVSGNFQNPERILKFPFSEVY